MAKFPVEEALLREPNLWVPGKKPVGEVKVDWTHPLARNLIGCWVFVKPGVFRDLADGYHATASGSITHQPDKFGMAVNVTDDVTSDRLNLGSITSADRLSGDPSGEISTYAFCFFGDEGSGSHGNGFPRIIDKSNSGSGANGWTFYLDVRISSAKLAFDIDGTGNSGTVDANMRNTYAGVGASASETSLDSTVRFFYNGGLKGTSSITNNFPGDTANTALLNWNHTTDRQFREPMYCIYVWDRFLSDEEHALIHSDPYQFLIPA